MMITVANAFILVLLLVAAALGVSAIIQKRTVRRDRHEEAGTNASS